MADMFPISSLDSQFYNCDSYEILLCVNVLNARCWDADQPVSTDVWFDANSTIVNEDGRLNPVLNINRANRDLYVLFYV